MRCLSLPPLYNSYLFDYQKRLPTVRATKMAKCSFSSKENRLIGDVLIAATNMIHSHMHMHNPLLPSFSMQFFCHFTFAKFITINVMKFLFIGLFRRQRMCPKKKNKKWQRMLYHMFVRWRHDKVPVNSEQ